MLTDIKEDILVFAYLLIVLPTVLLVCLIDHFLPKRPVTKRTTFHNR